VRAKPAAHEAGAERPHEPGAERPRDGV
jgi:hypothetical protein